MRELRIICPDIVKERILDLINDCGFGVRTYEVEAPAVQILRVEPASNWAGLYCVIDHDGEVSGVFRGATYDDIRKWVYGGRCIIDCMYEAYDGSIWIAVTDFTTGDPLIAMKPPIPGYKAPDDL